MRLEVQSLVLLLLIVIRNILLLCWILGSTVLSLCSSPPLTPTMISPEALYAPPPPSY